MLTNQCKAATGIFHPQKAVLTLQDAVTGVVAFVQKRSYITAQHAIERAHAAEWCYAKNHGTPDDYLGRPHAHVWWENDMQGVWKASIGSRFYSQPKHEVQPVYHGLLYIAFMLKQSLLVVHAATS